MAIVGSLSIDSKTIEFVIARTEAGFAGEMRQEMSEELVSPGVNGRRWRTVYTQFVPFGMTTISDASTYTVAVALKNRAENFTNKLCNLKLTVDGGSYTWAKVHVNAVRAVAVAGPVVYAGSSTGIAHMACEWNLVFTTQDQSVQAGS